MSNAPAQRRRLTRSADFDTVYRKGRSRSSRHVVVYQFPRDDGGSDARIGIAVSRKVGTAVVRNDMKRRIRAAMDELADTVPSGDDIVIVARPALVAAHAEHGQTWLIDELRTLLRTGAA